MSQVQLHELFSFQNPLSKSYLTYKMANFAMGTILGKVFTKVHTVHLCCDVTISRGCQTISQGCPHCKVAFSNSDLNKKCMIKICQIASFMSTMGKWDLIFHLPIVDYYIMQFDIKT